MTANDKDNTQYCRYCGVEIELFTLRRDAYSDIMTYDLSTHDKKCPLYDSKREFDTEQEAIDAYSMKGEG